MLYIVYKYDINFVCNSLANGQILIFKRIETHMGIKTRKSIDNCFVIPPEAC